MVLPPLLAATLVGPYGWRGGMLILGAVMGNILPCVCAFTISPGRDQSPKNNEKDKSQGQTTSGTERIDAKSCSPNEGKAAGTSQGENAPLLRSLDEIDQSSNSEPISKHGKRNHQVNSASSVNNEKSTIVKITNVLKKFTRDVDFYKDPICNLVILSSFFYCMLYSGWHAFLIPHALQRGISLYHTIIITFCASIGNLTGRLVSGLLTHRLVKPSDIFLFLSVVNVGLLLCYAFIQSFFAMLFLSFLSAWAIVGRGALPIMIIRKRASSDKFPIMLAFFDSVGGCGHFLGGYFSGTAIM